MLEAPDQQISLTDPDARSMNARGSGIVGYNVQTAVDPKNHLIVSPRGVGRQGGARGTRVAVRGRTLRAISSSCGRRVRAIAGPNNGCAITARGALLGSSPE
jgi:hypothetical protein